MRACELVETTSERQPVFWRGKRHEDGKKEIVLDFKDGMLVKSKVRHPSEALGFIGLPIEVAKAIVAIPTALFRLELEHTQNNAALLAEQKKDITLQREIMDAQKALLSAASTK